MAKLLIVDDHEVLAASLAFVLDGVEEEAAHLEDVLARARAIDEAVAAMGLADLFVTTLSTEELNGAGKPAPDVYLEVCRRIGVDPRSSVAVEDAHNGILSARAAGLRVVAIPPHFNPPPASTLALADVVLDSLDDLTTDLVAGLLDLA